MKYIAHKNGDREQTVVDHLEGTAELAERFASKFGKEDWGYCVGKLHDIGKYSAEFQRKIQNNTNEHVDHSSAGAQLCNSLSGYYPVLSYCIAGHHAGLPDYGNTAITSSLCGRNAKKICDYQAYKKEIQIPELHTDPIEMHPDKNLDFSLSVFIRMLYSCLVDADFLDTENFMKDGDTGRSQGEPLEILLSRLEAFVSDWMENTDTDTINGRRTEILKNCLKGGEREKGMFQLTVPTGGGKTIASLAFALRHAVKHKMDRVIYVIPYTSIIEQNAKVFRDIVGKDNVLENHYNVDYSSSEELRPMQLASENWDMPIVVTTNVQFFESLFANKSSKCRKLHNIANSVVILDEAQMLPLDYLKPCTSMLQEMVDSYEASVVLCTATQPSLKSFFTIKKPMLELCPRKEEQFRFFERVIYQNIGNISKEGLVNRLNEEKNALCIINTKRMAQELYKELKGEGVYHLSTSMYPKHRMRVLKKIRERLELIRKNEKPDQRCIVISTSLIEAGVDLDFGHVYRQLAGIDSIVQAAGRCNREGNNPVAESKVFIFDLEDAKSPLNQKLNIETASAILQDYKNLKNMECVGDYFSRLYHSRGSSLDKKNIIEEFRKREYNFDKVGTEFKIIEENTKTIFVPIETDAEILLQDLKIKGASKERMRQAGQYSIQVYANSNGKGNDLFSKLEGAGMLRPISEDLQDFYELTSLEIYSEECGLDFFVDDGLALFM